MLVRFPPARGGDVTHARLCARRLHRSAQRNAALAQRVVSGELPPQELVRLEPAQLGTAQQQEELAKKHVRGGALASHTQCGRLGHGARKGPAWRLLVTNVPAAVSHSGKKKHRVRPLPSRRRGWVATAGVAVERVIHSSSRALASALASLQDELVRTAPLPLPRHAGLCARFSSLLQDELVRKATIHDSSAGTLTSEYTCPECKVGAAHNPAVRLRSAEARAPPACPGDSLRASECAARAVLCCAALRRAAVDGVLVRRGAGAQRGQERHLGLQAERRPRAHHHVPDVLTPLGAGVVTAARRRFAIPHHLSSSQRRLHGQCARCPLASSPLERASPFFVVLFVHRNALPHAHTHDAPSHPKGQEHPACIRRQVVNAP